MAHCVNVLARLNEYFIISKESQALDSDAFTPQMLGYELLFFYKYDTLYKSAYYALRGHIYVTFLFSFCYHKPYDGGDFTPFRKRQRGIQHQIPSFKRSDIFVGTSIFSGISAVFKLLSPVAGNTPLVGDIIPALSGIFGCIVFFDRWLKASENQLTLPLFLTRILNFEQPIGFFCLFAGVTHLLFSQVLFL